MLPSARPYKSGGAPGLLLFAVLSLWQAPPAHAAATTPASATTSSASAAKASKPKQHFDIWEFDVAGNTLLPQTQVEKAVYPFLGAHKSIDAVEKARKALEKCYRDAGYGTVFVDIPEQQVVQGVVRLKVTEGRVGRLRVTGSRYFDLGWIKKQVPSLAEGKVPHLPDVQKQLAALNRASRDRSITPVLRAGKTPGTVDVDLRVKDQLPLHGEVELNNRYTQDTEPLRLNASIHYDNLWQRQHSFTLSYQVAPQDPNQVEVFSGTYLMPIPDSNKLLAFYAVSSSSDVATVGTLSVIGNGDIYGVRGIIPLAAGKDYFHSLTLGADYKDFKDSVHLLGADTLNTPISYLSFNAQYNATMLTEGANTRFGVGVNFGVRGLGNTTGEFENKRYKAKPNYIFLHVNAARTQKLWWGTSLLGRFSGQIADSPLVSNEQFSAGGVDSVRGYLESQVLGDDAVQGSLELHSPSAPESLFPGLQSLYGLAFVDAAKLRIIDPLPSQTSDYLLWSAGLGMSLAAWHHLSADLFWAYPFQTVGATQAGDSRVHFRVAYEF